MAGTRSEEEVEVMREPWSIDITDPFNRFLAKLLTFLPNLLVMIIILIIGFLIAWIVKRLLFHFLKVSQFDKLSERWGLAHVLSKGDISYSPSHVLIHVFYWLIIFIALILGINALQVPATEALITRFFNYLPHLLSAIFILIVGYLIASFLGEAALIAAVNLQLASARLFSRMVRWFIVILVLTMALYQLEIAEQVVVIAFAIILGGIVLALAIAFGWGGRDLAKGFIEKLYRRKEREGEEPPDRDRLSHL